MDALNLAREAYRELKFSDGDTAPGPVAGPPEKKPPVAGLDDRLRLLYCELALLLTLFPSIALPLSGELAKLDPKSKALFGA